MVLQDTWLFNGTIRDNIAYGEKTGMNKKLSRQQKVPMPMNLFAHYRRVRYVLGEDAANISQGQRQLMTIARAITRRPENINIR